jgi:hypothetical protein
VEEEERSRPKKGCGQKEDVLFLFFKSSDKKNEPSVHRIAFKVVSN